MAKYCKKPVVVEADVFRPVGLGFSVRFVSWDAEENRHYVTTIHGERATVTPGDWIIMEPDGIHAYPCKPDIFEATYELVEEVVGE